MCGIVGIIRREASVDQDIILRMRDSMTHRRPDDAGLYVSPDRKVALGNRRLAIIDLSPAGHQLLSNEAWAEHSRSNGTIWVTYYDTGFTLHGFSSPATNSASSPYLRKKSLDSEQR